MKKFNNEDAFTGLEAAIVLIAFVVVAAVFSYVVLGAGFFTTQKSQEVVHSGVTQAASNIVIKGEVYGIKNETVDAIDYIRFDIGLAAGGVPVDVNRTTMTFSTTAKLPYNLDHDSTLDSTDTTEADYTQMTAGTWIILAQSPGTSGDKTLQSAETFTIMVMPKEPLDTREKFLIEVKPEVGAALGIDRTVPSSVTTTTLLY